MRRTGADEQLVNALLDEHHYLGYTPSVGEHLKYLVSANGRPVACLVWCSPARRLGPRDRFIGWPNEVRDRNIHLIAYNTRYLVLPWVEVPNLASHILSRMARKLSRDWEEIYGHPIHFVETFVDPARHRGTCYLAANWTALGRTTGRGNADQTRRPNRPVKETLGYPLSRHFRGLLSGVE